MKTWAGRYVNRAGCKGVRAGCNGVRAGRKTVRAGRIALRNTPSWNTVQFVAAAAVC